MGLMAWGLVGTTKAFLAGRGMGMKYLREDLIRGDALRRAGPVVVMCVCALLMSGTAQGDVVTFSHQNSTMAINTGTSAGVYSWTIDGVEQLEKEWFWYRVGSGYGTKELTIDVLHNQAVTRQTKMLAWQ